MHSFAIVAVFSTHEDALYAIQRLHELHLATSSLTMPTACMLEVIATDQDHERVREALLEADALEVTLTAAEAQPSWFSHQNGAVTGTGVPPGAGDAEAGSPDGKGSPWKRPE
jgi:hypothetical protein